MLSGKVAEALVEGIDHWPAWCHVAAIHRAAQCRALWFSRPWRGKIYAGRPALRLYGHDANSISHFAVIGTDGGVFGIMFAMRRLWNFKEYRCCQPISLVAECVLGLKSITGSILPMDAMRRVLVEE